MTQLSIDPETGEEMHTKAISTNNRYNLRPKDGPKAQHTKTTCPHHDDTKEHKRVY